MNKKGCIGCNAINQLKSFRCACCLLYLNYHREEEGEMQKYRKLPVVISAIEWKGDNLREVIREIGLHQSANKWTWEEYKTVVEKEGLKIFTLEGSHMATVGDFIICGVHGEHYPCKPDIFWKTYEKVIPLKGAQDE